MNISRAGDASASSMVAESTTKVTGIPLAVAWAAQKLFGSFDTASDAT